MSDRPSFVAVACSAGGSSFDRDTSDPRGKMSRRRLSHSETPATSMNTSAAYPTASAMQNDFHYPRRGPIEGPNGRRLVRRVTWRSSTYKLMASLWVLGVLYIVWLIRDLFFLPFSSSAIDSVSLNAADDHLARYLGRQECGVSSKDLYNPPEAGNEDALRELYCQLGDSLLNAMSNGGRYGFDAAYMSQGCYYRWYSAAQVCAILQKFDGVLFIGEDMLANVYAAFNIILREDMAAGSLKESEISKRQLDLCQCDSQFTDSVCLSFRITSSDDLQPVPGLPATRSPYICPSRPSHSLVSISGARVSQAARQKFYRQVAKATGSKKPIPVIYSLSEGNSLSVSAAASSMDEWLELAKTSGHVTPFLWVGPTAPGHQKGNGNIPSDSEVWKYTIDTASAARARNMDVLGMYNATLQATSFDGMHYAEKVSLVQAMMIINWLASL